MRILRADVRDEIEMTSILHLDRRLVVYIEAGLRERHLCDERGVLARGSRALEEAEPGTRENVIGIVFQNPNSRVLWGRFVERDLRSRMSNGTARSLS